MKDLLLKWLSAIPESAEFLSNESLRYWLKVERNLAWSQRKWWS